MTMKKIPGILFRWLCVPVFLLLTYALLWAELEVAVFLPKDHLTWFFAGGFLIGSAIFTMFTRLTPFYVFGHEATHWVVAKLFRKETGKFRCRYGSGYVEIRDPNVWIILAPYFVPFYFLVFTGIWGLLDLLLPGKLTPFHPWLSGLLGLTYSYHLVLTFIALGKGQKDLDHKGKVFSLTLILAMNTFFFFLATLTVTKQWKHGLSSLADKISIILHKLILGPIANLF
jgi:hypothetical protein